MNKIAGHGFPGSWAFDWQWIIRSHDPPSILPRVFLVSQATLNNFQSRNRVGYTYHWEKKVIDRILDRSRVSDFTNQAQQLPTRVFNLLASLCVKTKEQENHTRARRFSLLFQKRLSRPLARNVTDPRTASVIALYADRETFEISPFVRERG